MKGEYKKIYIQQVSQQNYCFKLICMMTSMRGGTDVNNQSEQNINNKMPLNL